MGFRVVDASFAARHVSGLAIIIGLASAAAAQTPRDAGSSPPKPRLVRVSVTDSAGAPIAGAAVSIVRGLQEIVVEGTTDQDGRRALTIASPEGSYDAMVRRIGFARADRFFTPHSGDTVSLHFVLVPTAQTLAPVTVTAQEDAKHKRYFIDADGIANSTRPILDGMDVVTKLRPTMMDNPTPGSMDRCGLDNIWVNGERIALAPINEALATRSAAKQHGATFASPRGKPGAISKAAAGPAMESSGDGRVPVNVQSVLATIHPEHIAEMEFHDCNDFSINKAHATNALFVVLKPGVAFEPGIGSYVLGPNTGGVRTAVAARGLAYIDSVDTARPNAVVLESYRSRLLGLFDAASGEPIEGVLVADSASGAWVKTPATGIVSLAFLPPGASTVRVQRPGVRDTLVHLTISPRDTTPITLTLGAPH